MLPACWWDDPVDSRGRRAASGAVVHAIRKERTMPSRAPRPFHASFCRRAGFLLLAALLFGGIAAPRALAAAISFLPPVSYPMTGASGMTAVDLDGDGNIDLVVGDISSGR